VSSSSSSSSHFNLFSSSSPPFAILLKKQTVSGEPRPSEESPRRPAESAGQPRRCGLGSRARRRRRGGGQPRHHHQLGGRQNDAVVSQGSDGQQKKLQRFSQPGIDDNTVASRLNVSREIVQSFNLNDSSATIFFWIINNI
jgi:hypothetical protein